MNPSNPLKTVRALHCALGPEIPPRADNGPPTCAFEVGGSTSRDGKVSTMVMVSTLTVTVRASRSRMERGSTTSREAQR